MKNLVRGGVILSLIGMFVVIIYAQTKTEDVLSIAKDSQKQLNNSLIDKNLISEEKPAEIKQRVVEETNKAEQDKQENKIVEKTVSSRSTGGVSRGMFSATAYCLKGRTAMGHGVRRGIIAADPRVLPLGSRINIGAGAYSGTYLVSDTGGRIKGKKLDIWMASCSEARRFGRRNVSVSFLGR